MDNTTNLRLFETITEHLISDDYPSQFIEVLSLGEEFDEYPFSILKKLKDTEQSKQYHPEGSVWNHTMLVVDEAAKVRNKSNDVKAFMWAALLHDIGKPATTKARNGKITSYDHDKVGEKLSIDFLLTCSVEDDFARKVASLIRYHMHILYVLKKLPYADINGLVKNVDANDIALLCRCDRMGRTGVDYRVENSEYHKFLAELTRLHYKD